MPVKNSYQLKWTSIAAVLFCSLACSIVRAQNQSVGRSSPSRVATTTRLVVVFSDLETQWLHAVQQKDIATLDRLLDNGFEVWTAQAPGAPIPRDDWQRQAFAQKLTSFRLREVAVRGLSDQIAVASFLLSETFERAGHPQTSNYFVVDVWHKKGENWQCTDRYTSPIQGPFNAAAKNDRKPTGKE